MKPLEPGIRLRESFEVTDEDTASAIGNPGVDAISTMVMIKLVETACGRLVAPAYEEGDATVVHGSRSITLGQPFRGGP